MTMDLLSIAAAFDTEGEVLSCQASGNGHINRTFTVAASSGRRYILQSINHHVFRDVEALMRNIEAVTAHLKARCGGDPRRVLTLVKTREGKTYLEKEDGEFFRMFIYVENSVCLEQAETAEDFYRSAAAFGEFQNQLSDFPANTLAETIPHFHDTPDRYRQFHQALKSDPLNRAGACKAEIDFVLAREKDAGAMVDMLRDGRLPLRVTHNDTKLNNIMFDAVTREPLCVIDLDTVMPGLAGNDFGDSIRFGASTATEDERDLSKVHFSLSLFRAYAQGFLGACGKTLTALEIETLPLASRLMTLEVGLRFLTDHLNGDTYFSIARENHNLDRCRTQFRLMAEMEEKDADMRRVIRETVG